MKNLFHNTLKGTVNPILRVFIFRWACSIQYNTLKALSDPKVRDQPLTTIFTLQENIKELSELNTFKP